MLLYPPPSSILTNTRQSGSCTSASELPLPRRMNYYCPKSHWHGQLNAVNVAVPRLRLQSVDDRQSCLSGRTLNTEHKGPGKEGGGGGAAMKKETVLSYDRLSVMTQFAQTRPDLWPIL